MTEVCDRTLRAKGPALLFEKPTGFDIPVLGNLHLVTPAFFDIGVYLIVVGLVLDILRSLGGRIDERIERSAVESRKKRAGRGARIRLTEHPELARYAGQRPEPAHRDHIGVEGKARHAQTGGEFPGAAIVGRLVVLEVSIGAGVLVVLGVVLSARSLTRRSRSLWLARVATAMARPRASASGLRSRVAQAS